MADAVGTFAGRDVVAPSLAPNDFVGILQDADALLALMGRQTLDVVANLAHALTVSANSAKAWEIAEAASAVRRNALGRHAAMLTGAMRALSDAIARAQHECHLER